MSLFSYNPANQLANDALLVIFDQLDYQDLLRCEIVCRKWRIFLLSGRPWRRLFHRQTISSPQWRQVWRNFRVDEENLETVHYRELCRAIIKKVNEIDNNWRNGNYKIIEKQLDLESYKFPHVVIGKDWIANVDYGDWLLRSVKKILFCNRMNLVVQHCIVIPRGAFPVTNAEIVVLLDRKNIKILGINGRLISKVPELNEDERISWNLASCCLSRNQMAVISQTDGKEKLSLWDVSDPSQVIHLKSQWFSLDLRLYSSSIMRVDEQFIAISNYRDKCTTFYFFSKKTLDIHWQKTIKSVGGNMSHAVYDNGILVLYLVRIRQMEMYDVASGQCFRTIGISFQPDLKQKVVFNSKFMVVAETNVFWKSQLKIYDMEAIKNPKSTENDLLVRTVAVNFQNYRIAMDETLLICAYFHEIRLLDFGSFEYFQNAAKSVTLSLPWRSVWRSKGVDEEPLEPARHMEVYKEVLQYFHQLTINCQTASKTFPVNNVGLETFSIGDDFIGYRRHNPNIVTFDENMDESCQEINYKTVQISKNTYVSVMGKTILLMDKTTGQVINDERLERVPSGWHFNCNLLVCVHNIAEHGHLLSVWRIENSSNLNHIKDVAIEDYDGSLQVDDNFIAVETAVQERAGTKTYNFISMKTFQVERSLSSRAKYFAYDKGCLFLRNKNLVRILDVASGTFLRDMRMEPDHPDSIILFCCANSSYVAMLSCNNVYSKLNVYDLKCLKETDTVPSHLLLTTIDLECKVKKMLMNETRIVCLYDVPRSRDCKMYVVDLKPIERLKCPEYNE